jgi:hypothetical protein
MNIYATVNLYFKHFQGDKDDAASFGKNSHVN